MSSPPVGDAPLPTTDTLLDWDLLPAVQQPLWQTHPAWRDIRETLLHAAPLTSYAETAALRTALAGVARGDARVLQSGDCAERFDECTPGHVSAKVAVLDSLADLLTSRTGQDVVRVGRMGGQFAKPRSRPTDRYGDCELPAFRGHMINSAEPALEARRHDPWRMLQAYEASHGVFAQLRDHRRRRGSSPAGRALGPWACHEALVVDYEGPLVRPCGEEGGRYLASTHLPWIGERTRQPDGAHVTMLAEVRNPVACKIGPSAAPEDVVRLCGVLDPERTPGRLTLILRFGRDRVEEAMPGVVDAVRRAGHPVVWTTDPMHGNTVRTAGGTKTRHLRAVVAEAQAFRRILERRGLHAGGVHLETAGTGVTECVGGDVPDEEALTSRYRTLCDPRLNPEQAHEVVEALF
jgi:3-deoxy-7-phosphoheptulonate synthase